MLRCALVLLVLCGCGIDQTGIGIGDSCDPGAERSCVGEGVGSSIGECRLGEQTCGSDGRWGVCDDVIVAVPERCDEPDRDFDCDGSPLNGCECTVGETTTCSVPDAEGACIVGEQACGPNGTFDGTPCTSVTIPDDEVCNAPIDDPTNPMYDEDCDGVVDEGTDRESFYSDMDGDDYGINEIQVCGIDVEPPEGYARESGDCNDENPDINPGADDRSCDLVDDDCDGSVDEAFVETSTTCGVGVCGQSGVIECTGGMTNNTCTPGQPTGADDDCDGVDEDCDGNVDEHYVAAATTCGQGACVATGMLECDDGELDDTCEAGAPSSDNNCNTVDEDCDGTLDEGFMGMNVECGEGVCFATGTEVCAGGVVTEMCMPGSPLSSDDDNCDNMDDDCDGITDEDGGVMYQWDGDNDGYLDDSPPAGWVVSSCGDVPEDAPADAVAGGMWRLQSMADGGDCDDADPEVNPGMTDMCGVDRDCDRSNNADVWFCPCTNGNGSGTNDCSCQERVIGSTTYILCEEEGTRDNAAARCGHIATIRGYGEDIGLAIVDSAPANTAIEAWMNETTWENGAYSSWGAYFGLVCPGSGDNRTCEWQCNEDPPAAPDFPPANICNESNNYRGVIGRAHADTGKEWCGAGRSWSGVPDRNQGFLCQVFASPCN